jgi:hypothetical protein
MVPSANPMGVNWVFFTQIASGVFQRCQIIFVTGK